MKQLILSIEIYCWGWGEGTNPVTWSLSEVVFYKVIHSASSEAMPTL